MTRQDRIRRNASGNYGTLLGTMKIKEANEGQERSQRTSLTKELNKWDGDQNTDRRIGRKRER